MIKRNENTAEFVGLSFGDGGLTYRTGTKSLRFQLRGSLEEDKEHYDNYIIPLFNKEISSHLFDTKVGIVFNKKAGFYGISKQSEKLKVFSDELGIPIGVKKELFIPVWIKSSQKFTKGFLRGFFDTDGSVTCQRNYSIKDNKFHTQIRIILSCCSKNLIKEIYELLRELDFKCMFKSEKRVSPWNNSYAVNTG